MRPCRSSSGGVQGGVKGRCREKLQKGLRGTVLHLRDYRKSLRILSSNIPFSNSLYFQKIWIVIIIFPFPPIHSGGLGNWYLKRLSSLSQVNRSELLPTIYLYMCVFLLEFLCNICMQEPIEARRGCQISGIGITHSCVSWQWVLKTKPGSSARLARTLNSRAI